MIQITVQSDDCILKGGQNRIGPGHMPTGRLLLTYQLGVVNLPSWQKHLASIWIVVQG